MENESQSAGFSSVGLALGGGGVKGLAHIPLLKLLDRYKIKPKQIAGTSMGAIMGALYASGMSGEDIEARVLDHAFPKGEKIQYWIRRRKNLIKWTKLFKLEKTKGGWISAGGLFEHLFSELNDLDFNDLVIPYKAVAVDLNTGEEVVLDSGEVLAAVRASMAVPGIFAPVKHRGRTLVDGGIVNNVPVSQVVENTKFSIASDVISLQTHNEPSTAQVIGAAVDIMLSQGTKYQFDKYSPDLLFAPDTRGIEAFDFWKIKEVLSRGEKAVESFLPKLDKVLGITAS